MPRVPIAPENRTSGDAEKFPSLSFTQKGERQRILCLDTISDPSSGRRVVAPVRVWVHLLKAPKIMDGQPLMKPRDAKDASKGMEWDLDFIGQSLCLGDQQQMQAKGSDPGNCMTCQANKDFPKFVPPPQVYFSMNVLRYATVPGKFEVSKPFSASIVAWKLTERRFNKLVDLGQELANGTLTLFSGQTVAKDLSLVDLRLGPCEDTGYQKYDIAAAEGVAVARSGQQIQDYVVRNIWGPAENRATDEQLEEVCGRRQTNLAYLQADIDRCLDQWRRAERAGAAGADNLGGLNGAKTGDMQTGLEGLLDEVGAAQGGPVVSPSDPWLTDAAPQPDAATPEPPVPTTAAEPMLPPTPAEQEAAAGPGGLDQFAPPEVAAPADVLAAPDLGDTPAPAGDALSFGDLMDQIKQGQ